MSTYSNVRFSTTNSIPGFDIVEYKGVVFDRVVAGVGFITEFFASFSDVFGGRSEKTEDQMDSIYKNLLFEISQKAESMGANAIVGFSIDIDELSGKGTSMLMISGTGTAVVVQAPMQRTENKIRKKEIPWKCVKCGVMNTWEMGFCPICGERRHFDWKCSNCKTDNPADFNFCPSCGKARAFNEENIIDFSPMNGKKYNKEDVYEQVDLLNKASEVYDYFKQFFDGVDDEDVSFFLSRIENLSKQEKIYGNAKKEAMRYVKGFFDHDLNTYTIDSSKENIECPVCGTKQDSYTRICKSCGALFRDA